MTYFEALKVATGKQYLAVLCQQRGAAKDRHISAMWAWLSSGTESSFAEMQAAENHLESIETAIAMVPTHE